MTPLPFHWHPLFPLRPPCSEGVVHLSLEQKLQWMFWCEKVLRGGLKSHLPPYPGSPEGDGWRVLFLGLWRAQCTEGHPTSPLVLVHGPQMGGNTPTYHSNTWNLWCSLLISGTSKLLGSAVPCKAGQTAGIGERLAFHQGCRNSSALLWKLIQWTHCASTALANITKPDGNDRSEGAMVRRNYVFVLVSMLNLIFHAPKWTRSCFETFVAHSWRELSSALRFLFSKKTILFWTSSYTQEKTSWVFLDSPTLSRNSDRLWV